MSLGGNAVNEKEGASAAELIGLAVAAVALAVAIDYALFIVSALLGANIAGRR